MRPWDEYSTVITTSSWRILDSYWVPTVQDILYTPDDVFLTTQKQNNLYLPVYSLKSFILFWLYRFYFSPLIFFLKIHQYFCKRTEKEQYIQFYTNPLPHIPWCALTCRHTKTWTWYHVIFMLCSDKGKNSTRLN